MTKRTPTQPPPATPAAPSRAPLERMLLTWLRKQVTEEGASPVARRLGVPRSAVVTAAAGASLLRGNREMLERAIEAASK